MKKSLAIDIGGTNIRYAIFNNGQEILSKNKIDNDKSLKATESLDKLIELIKNDDNFEGIEFAGVACPGPLDLKNGKILNPSNIPLWNNFKIVDYLESKLNLRVYLDNDANLAAFGEHVCGAAKGSSSTYYITISTGLGGGYVLDNKVVVGANSCGSEIANMFINSEDANHPVLFKGSLESHCSGTGLGIIYSDLKGSQKNAGDLFKDYANKDADAIKVIDTFVNNVSKGIANLMFVTDPEFFVIGGSVMLKNNFLLDMIKEKLSDYLWESQYKNLKLKIAELGDDSGLYGAANVSLILESK